MCVYVCMLAFIDAPNYCYETEYKCQCYSNLCYILPNHAVLLSLAMAAGSIQNGWYHMLYHHY